jgi:putative oxidoreductase
MTKFLNRLAPPAPMTAWSIISWAIGLLDRIPYSLVALIARAATFTVFWRSGSVKLADWNSTLLLFANVYRVPLLPPTAAAYMSACLELGGSVLVLLGLMTRLSIFLLLGMVLVIQVFVMPNGWPDHIQWLGFMFILLARGPGALSLDALIRRAIAQGGRGSLRALPIVLGAIMLVSGHTAHSQDMVSFATGGYASGLRTEAMMHKMDVNHDNMVSRKEWVAFQSKVFAMLDKKRTGEVDESEYLSVYSDVAAFATGGYASGLLTREMFKKIDSDGDGRISRREFMSYQLKIFDMLDTSRTHRGMLGPAQFFATGGSPAP